MWLTCVFLEIEKVSNQSDSAEALFKLAALFARTFSWNSI